MKKLMIDIGNFLFKYRNKLFPLIVVAIFAIESPRMSALGSIIAVAIALSGLIIRGLVIGYAYIKRGGVNKKVYAENLVTEGLFGVCRNPLYVGNMLIYAGVFLLHGSPLVAIIGIGLFLFIYQCIIYAEEAYLENKFGEGYKNYCSEVPRWIPNLTNYKSSTEGMSFDFGKALKKDYSTIATTLGMLALTQIYKYISMPDSELYTGNIELLVALMVLTAILAGTVRYFKKHNASRKV
jgi:protein-S-isoprenylcysteine O-methyltransferase Ste14